MANRYKVWKPPVSISDDVAAFDQYLEDQYKDGYKVKCSFRDVIIFERFSNPRKIHELDRQNIVVTKETNEVAK